MALIAVVFACLLIEITLRSGLGIIIWSYWLIVAFSLAWVRAPK